MWHTTELRVDSSGYVYLRPIATHSQRPSTDTHIFVDSSIRAILEPVRGMDNAVMVALECDCGNNSPTVDQGTLEDARAYAQVIETVVRWLREQHPRARVTADTLELVVDWLREIG